MNQKKAKRLRALVKHLQNRGATEGTSWLKYSSYPEMSERAVINAQGKLDHVPYMVGQAVLDQHSGRSIYQQLKKAS
jgi:hypothetical protein